MRDLYDLFRDGIIEDALRDGSLSRSSWSYIPTQMDKNGAGTRGNPHVGRMQTLALIRRFMMRATKEFPGGMTMKGDTFAVSEEFILFAKTHREMGSSFTDMVTAWQALQSVA